MGATSLTTFQKTLFNVSQKMLAEVKRNERNEDMSSILARAMTYFTSLQSPLSYSTEHKTMATPAPPASDKPWLSYLTIDLLVHVLNRSIFHPYIAWLIPLCLRAAAKPYEAPEFIAACVWAGAVTLLAILQVVNKRIAYGLPREVDWDEEVVVITGGANGLGKILAEMYGMRGASVAVLDVAKPEQESEGFESVQFYTCDVGDAAAVQKAKGQIEKDVCSRPTLLSLHFPRSVADGKHSSSAYPPSSSTTPAS